MKPITLALIAIALGAISCSSCPEPKAALPPPNGCRVHCDILDENCMKLIEHCTKYEG